MLNRLLIVILLSFCLTQCNNKSYTNNVQVCNKQLLFDIYNPLEKHTYINSIGDTIILRGAIKRRTYQHSIIYHDIQRKYCPKTNFEKISLVTSLQFITNYYLMNITPFDSCFSLGYGSIHLEHIFVDDFKDVNFEEYDREQIKKWSQDTLCMRIKRGDFWNRVFELNKEYSNPESFAMIETAIKEAYKIWKLDMNDTIYMQKNAFDILRSTYDDIFTNMKDEINPIYLK